MATPKDVAAWMLAQLDENDELLQVDAVAEIQRLFGHEFVYIGDNGEMAIDRRVLYQFRKLSGNGVVWVTEHHGVYWSGAHWRKRCPGDSPGRIQYVD
jgi:Family of unknown function (DUF6953)